MIELLHIATASIERTSDACGYAKPSDLGYEQDRSAEDMHVSGTTLVEVYYGLCRSLMRIPTQHEFIDKYARDNQQWFAANASKGSGMLFRVARAWPSLVSEHHLFSLFVESGECRTAYKGADEDVSSGSDMRIVGRIAKDNIYIATFSDTPMSWKMARRKWRKPSGLRLYMPLNFAGKPEPQIVGGRKMFRLYTPAHITNAIEASLRMIEERWSEATSLRGQVYEGLKSEVDIRAVPARGATK
jgi:hypothetical protein